MDKTGGKRGAETRGRVVAVGVCVESCKGWTSI